MNGELEEQLKNELLKACRKVRYELNYNSTYFLRMLGEKGAKKTAIQLVSSPEPLQGFTRLWEAGRLALSVEAHVIKKEYCSLFTTEVIEMAPKRLEKYEYEPEP